MEVQVGDRIKYLIAGVVINVGIVQSILDEQHVVIKNSNGRIDTVAVWQITEVTDSLVIANEAYKRAMKGI